MQSPFNILICDLGNVLLFFDHWLISRRVGEHTGLPAEEVHERFMASNLHRQYGRGRLGDQTFYHEALELFAPAPFPEFDSFATMWSDIFRINQPMIDAVIRLRDSGTTCVLLSNTNSLHIEWVKEKYPEVLAPFENRLALSYEIGFLKPEEQIYQVAMEMAGKDVRPGDCLFVDDLEEHVAAAQLLGMQSHLFTGVEGFLDTVTA